MVRVFRGTLGVLLFVILTAGATALGFSVAARDDALRLQSLIALKPLVDPLIAIGNVFTEKGAHYSKCILGAIVLALAITGLRLGKPRRDLLVLGLVIAFVGQWVMIDGELRYWLSQSLLHANPDDASVRAPLLIVGGASYVLSLVCFFLAFRGERPLSPVLNQGALRAAFSVRDALLLFFVCLVGLFFRLYAINYIPDKFEGELACFSAGGTSLYGLLLANKGVAGPWAPLGILYYLPIYATTSMFGASLAALRMSSALVGVFTIPLMFLLGNRLGGKQMGLLAALLLALDTLHIGWGRTDVHPHGVTTWPSLLICWLLLRAFDSRRVIDAAWVALAMALTWHQYPSGQSAVAIPVFAVGAYWLFNRFSFPLRWVQLPWIGIGVALWFLGLPLSYYYPEEELVFQNPFNLTGPRAMWGRAEGDPGTLDVALMVLEKAFEHLWAVVLGVFYKVPFLFHQDIVPYVPGFNVRTVGWVLVPFAVLGFFMVVRSIKRFECAVLLAWMLAAILPGIMSESPYPKRLSSFFPAVEMLSAFGIVRYMAYLDETGQAWRRWIAKGALLTGFSCYFLWACNAWFAGRPDLTIGEPPEVLAAEEMAKEIKPRTIIIADLIMGYHVSKMTYLLLDPLAKPENRPNLWLPLVPELFPQAIADPLRAGRLNNDWVYQWTKLRDQKAETDSFTGWDRVVFMIQERTEGPDANGTEIASVIERCKDPKVRRIEKSGTFWLPVVIVSCNVSDLR